VGRLIGNVSPICYEVCRIGLTSARFCRVGGPWFVRESSSGYSRFDITPELRAGLTLRPTEITAKGRLSYETQT